MDEVLNELWNSGLDNFELHVYGNKEKYREYEKKHNSYCSEELDEIMNQFDCLIVPSIWKETFGFTLLEAMSYGIPVIASDNVGAKDLIRDHKNGIVYSNGKLGLKSAIIEVLKNPQIIDKYNREIFMNFKVKTMENHAKEILTLYNRVKGRIHD